MLCAKPTHLPSLERSCGKSALDPGPTWYSMVWYQSKMMYGLILGVWPVIISSGVRPIYCKLVSAVCLIKSETQILHRFHSLFGEPLRLIWYQTPRFSCFM